MGNTFGLRIVICNSYIFGNGPNAERMVPTGMSKTIPISPKVFSRKYIFIIGTFS
jgi:hypothetical protein